MPCYRPLSAWRSVTGEVYFGAERGDSRSLTLPCGQCIGCRLERSRQWAVRCVHESQLHEFNSFVTLTYNNINFDFSLNYLDFQLFLKRLRKRLGQARFFMCGEYGERYFRPHFHALLFGVHFPDRILHSERGGFRLYRSAVLDSLWKHGFASIGDVTFESAAYVARYCVKKVTGSGADAYYRRVDPETGECFQVEPEFSGMSLKPAIGLDWLRLYWPEVVAHNGKVISRNVEATCPRYYAKYLSGLRAWDRIEYSRYQEALLGEEHQSPERLAVREVVAKAGLKTLRRDLE